MKTFVKQGPFGVDAFPRSLNAFFDTLVQDAQIPVREASLLPRTDISESEKAYELSLVLPGIKKEDIHIEIIDNKLIVKGERKKAQAAEGVTYHKVESQYGHYERSFILPKQANAAEISAHQSEGILTIQIPKSETVLTTKKIEVK